MHAFRLGDEAHLRTGWSTAVYPTLTDKMAMQVGSKVRFSEVQARHWEQLAKAAGLSGAQTKKRLAEIAKQLPSCAQVYKRKRCIRVNRW